MDLLSIQLFRDIAREKSFVKAAALNHRTQPAVSFHIKKLEEEFGVKLFDRGSKKMILTAEGELLLSHAEDILERCENMQSILQRQKRQLPSGSVKVATIYSIGMYELPSILKKFIHAYPRINLHHQYLKFDVIYDLVEKRSIDMGIVAYPQPSKKVDIISFGSDRMVLIASPRHRLAKRRSVNLEEIRGEKFISFDPGIPTGDMLRKMLAQKGIQVTEHSTNENIDTLKRSVEVGLGISIVPRRTVREEVEKKTLIAVKIRDAEITRPLGILVAKGRTLSYPAELFLRMLTQNTPSSPAS